MVAIATLPGPQAPVGKQVNLFYNTSNNNLGLEQRSEGKGQDPPEVIYVASGTDQPGYILNPSHIASADLAGVGLVFGFTKQKVQAVNVPAGVANPPAPTHNDVSIISPIYRSIASTELGNTSIAACSSAEVAWVFYFSGGSGNPLVIKEEIVGDSNPASYDDTPTILPGSGLAAYYVSSNDNRFVIYQTKNSLREFQAHGSDSPIQYAEAADKSPLGAVYAKSKAYLYYRTGHSELRKVVKESDVWGLAQAIPDSRPVDADSQIAVIYAGGYNHIFYAAENTATGKFVHLKDPVE
ncbi:hypothetical protein F4781DRAFT_409986 [Annulohypoxylon bovei var. microspora]|nr:hypothetical protein F4781DRAFT_409986 [Annulohypoxylon bovei var. microspora]